MLKKMICLLPTVAIFCSLLFSGYLYYLPEFSNNVTNGTIATSAANFTINVIDVQSYPILGGNWIVRFNTSGTANLTIKALDGTEFGRDIEFLELRCGDRSLTNILIDGVVFVENYTCDEGGYEISKVLTSGGHTLEFRFGNDVEHAYNQALVGYPLLYDSIEGGWTNSTGSNPGTLDCATKGNFTGCNPNGNDYQAGADDGSVYAGTYSLCMEDWDTLDTTMGVWYSFNPSTACGGATCDYINLTYAFNSVSMDTGEFCRVLGDDDTVTARILWTCVATNCTTTYASYTVNLSRALDHTDTNWNIRFVQDASGVDDECWWDDFYIAGYKTRKGTSISLWINDTGADYDTVYGASVNATAKINTTGLPVTILINGTIIGNGPTRGVSILNASNLANATYNITANFTGNASHDGSSAQYMVRVEKGNPQLRLALNGTEGDFDYAFGQIVNLTAWSTMDVPNITIYTNYTGALLNVTPTGESPMANSTNTGLLSEAAYMVKANITVSANWTSNFTGVNYTMRVIMYPQFSGNATNGTVATSAANFTVNVINNVILDNSAGYIFSTNNSGSWINASYVAFVGSGTTQAAWNVTILNSVVGALVQWRFFANDTSNNWNASQIYNLTATAATDTAFSVAMPTSYTFQSITGTTEGLATQLSSDISFNFTSVPQSNVQPWVGPDFDGTKAQEGTEKPIFLIRNDGNVAINILLKLSASPQAGITLSANCSCTGTCTSCQTAETTLTTDYQQLVTGLSIGAPNYANITLWADVDSGVAAGITSTWLYLNSST